MSIETSIGLETGQPYPYRRTELVEPDWTRFPGWKDVTAEEWASALWQRAHCVKNVKQLRELMGDLVGPQLSAGVEALGGLREHAGRCDHPVEADGAALLAHGCPL